MRGRLFRRKKEPQSLWGCFTRGAVLAAAVATVGCTHLMQTNADDLPDRMHLSEFSFARPEGSDWYLNNTINPPTVIEFTKRGHQSESQILVIGYRPDERVTNTDELFEWAQGLPDTDKIVALAPGHGATCIRYHGRSTLTVNYADTSKPSADVMVTDEDSLECIDPNQPGLMVRFIVTQRSASGGTPAGARSAEAFLSSVSFDQTD